MKKTVLLTQESYDALKKELEYMKNEGAKEVAEAIKEARGYGDLSENSEYDEAKNEQGRLYSRMAELEEILSNCVVIEEEESDGDYIRMGSTVVVYDKEFEEEQTFRITGSQEADPMNGLISEDSPFGKALMGRVAGDEITVDAPAGAVEYKILSVEH